MFTIKHISIVGEEKIFAVDGVRFTPGVDGNAISSQTPPTLWLTDKGWDERPLTGGTVFVMNDNGKTVSRYDLGASPVPIFGDGLSDPRNQGVGRAA